MIIELLFRVKVNGTTAITTTINCLILNKQARALDKIIIAAKKSELAK